VHIGQYCYRFVQIVSLPQVFVNVQQIVRDLFAAHKDVSTPQRDGYEDITHSTAPQRNATERNTYSSSFEPFFRFVKAFARARRSAVSASASARRLAAAAGTPDSLPLSSPSASDALDDSHSELSVAAAAAAALLPSFAAAAADALSSSFSVACWSISAATRMHLRTVCEQFHSLVLECATPLP
jgi:hypothetical protein